MPLSRLPATLLVLLALGCADEPAPTPAPTAPGDASPTPGTLPPTPAPSTDGNLLAPAQGNVPTPQPIPPATTPLRPPRPSSGDVNDLAPWSGPQAASLGRVGPSPDDVATLLTWAETGQLARFTGSNAVTVVVDHRLGSPLTSYLNIVVDGRPAQLMPASGGPEVPATLTLGGLDPDLVHTIRVTKRTEAMYGDIRLVGLVLSSGGRFLRPPALSERRIEVIGDSISNGWGNVGRGLCAGAPEDQDASLTYGAMVGRMLGADVRITAWAGRGLACNADGTTDGLVPLLWQRTFAADPASHDDHSWVPGAVVVNLGTNDLAGGNIGEALYRLAYANFIAQLRAAYGPQTHIFAAVSPMLGDPWLSSQKAWLASIVADAQGAGDAHISLIDFSAAQPHDNSGCAAHPQVAGNLGMALSLKDAVAGVWGDANASQAALCGQTFGLDDGGATLTLDAVTEVTVGNPDGRFCFAPTVPVGSGYDVRLKAQPIGHTCSVLNGQGVAHADVDDLFVVCSRNVQLAGQITIDAGVQWPVHLIDQATGTRTFAVHGPYRFFDERPPGTPYSAQVVRAPYRQSCAPAGPAPATGAASGQALNWTCSAITYPIAVDVSGLDGTQSITLRNGADAVQVSTSGRVTFPTQVPIGGLFAVSVDPDPSHVLCAVSSGAGVVGDTAPPATQVSCQVLVQVAGTASGMKPGGQLALVRNDQVLTVSAASPAWSFTDADLPMRPLNLFVQKHPTGQTCTIAQPDGNRISPAARNLVVDCTDNPVGQFAIGGTVAGLSLGKTVALTQGASTGTFGNGPFNFGGSVADGASYTVAVGAQPPATHCDITSNSGTVSGGDVSGVQVTCAMRLTFANNQAAAQVLGQGSGTTHAPYLPGQPTPAGLRQPHGRAALVGNSLLLPDTGGFRATAYYPVPSLTGATASWSLGQTSPAAPAVFNFVSGTSSQMSPVGLSADASHLAVTDALDHRVLLFSPLPGAYGPAQVVVGQPDFVTTQAPNPPTASSLASPRDAILVGGRLIVVDRLNNRVLIWNSVPAANGTPADLVLGQADMVSNGVGGGSTGFNSPWGAWSDGVRLMVTDFFNSRVLVWSTFPTVNHQPADYVLGQPDFFTVNYNQADNVSLFGPTSVTSDGNAIFVADFFNNRIAVFDGFPSGSHTPTITAVLGQPDVGNVNTLCNQSAAAGQIIVFPDNAGGAPDLPAPTSRTLCGPVSVGIIGDRLAVTDMLNHRVNIYISNP